MPSTQQLSYRQIIVGRFPIGLAGLDEVFDSLYQSQKEPADTLATELTQLVRRNNYIPASAEQDYALALLREYRKYWELRNSGQDPLAKRPAWQGIPREQVAWFPVLDESQCDGCDKCLSFCTHSVYAKRESGVVYVAQPLNCVVGCDACARLCRHGAILFPPRSMLTTLGAAPSAGPVHRLR